MLSFSLITCALLPLLSLALPSPPTRSLHRRASHRPRIITYYPDWAPPKSINYSLFDIVIYAFAYPDRNLQLEYDSEDAPTSLARLVHDAHAAGTVVMLSVGGWAGSRYFSSAVANAQNREIFADNILATYNLYKLDGIDIDWEYPGQIGQQGNSENPADSANMLEFFKVLRQKFPSDAMISAAVQDIPFTGSDGQPMKDVSAFAHVVQFVTLMNYDTFESRAPPGPNAPLSDGCGNSSQPNQNAVNALKSWTSAGFPASQILLGVPAYGYVINSYTERLSARSPSRAYADDSSGQIQFHSLIDQGILAEHSDGSFRGSSGFTREWDTCSSTPFLRSDSAGQVISYDDNESLGIKAAWVKEMNMGGVNMFDVHGDTPQYHLTNALRANLLPSSTQPTALPSAVAAIPNTTPPTTSGPSSSSTSQRSPVILPSIPPSAIVVVPRGS